MKTAVKKKDLNYQIEYLKNEVDILRHQLSFKLRGDQSISSKAAIKENQRLYRKAGKKFIPINDPYAYDGLREGFWLIQIKGGSTSIRQQIWPDKSALHAAAREMEEQLLDIIRKATEARPSSQSLTAEQQKDWEWFIAKHGESFNTLQYPSFQENAERIVKVLIGE